MKLFQSSIEEIQRITGKEYEVDYSNNGESEYIKVYNTQTLEEIIEDLLEVIRNERNKR